MAGADAPDQTHLDTGKPDAVVRAALGIEQESVGRHGVFHESLPGGAGEAHGDVHRACRPDSFKLQIENGAVQVVVLADIDLSTRWGTAEDSTVHEALAGLTVGVRHHLRPGDSRLHAEVLAEVENPRGPHSDAKGVGVPAPRLLIGIVAIEALEGLLLLEARRPKSS